MPFIEQTSRAFSIEGIEWLTPNQSGVYGLFKKDAWIYVGKGDMRQRLLDHFNGDNPCITRESPTSWMAEKISGDPSAREKELILELKPICNIRVG